MKKVFKYLAMFLGMILLLALVLGLVYRKKIMRVQQVNHLFDEDQITQNFMNMDEIFPVHVIGKAEKPYILPQGEKMELPETFTFGNKQQNTREFLDHISNTGFLILRNDSIVYEDYRKGHQPETQHISWSMSKSYVSALFGIAMEEGKIKSLQETVTDYVPELKGSGYDNVRIKDVLQMSSGVRFNEDYADFYSDINRMGRTVAFGTSLDKFAASLKNEREPGTYNHYVSIDTHVLGMIIRNATGVPMHEYLEEKIWKRIGTESDAYWLKDDKEVSFVLGGLNATLRDYARFGRLYLNDGNWNGEQIVPAEWVRASVTPDAPHLIPGPRDNASTSLGYGYQWWIPYPSDGDFLAVGIHSQSIYVNPRKGLVIAFNSSNARFNDPNDESKDMFISLFQEIARRLPDVSPRG